MTQTVFTSTGAWKGPTASAPSTRPIGFATSATQPAAKPSGLVVVKTGLVVIR